MIKKLISKVDLNRSLLITLILLLIICFIIILLIVVPLTFDLIYGDVIIDTALTEIIGNASNPDEIALSMMAWEHEYFDNPYSHYDANSTFQKFGLYRINGKTKLFVRGAPISWIIYSKLANCGEYAKIFVILMNEAGVESRFVHVLGEDHAWAEYMHDGYRIAVDPSTNYVIGVHKMDFEKRMNNKFSYIESIDLQSNKKDVSDEYIERGNVTFLVFDDGQPISKAKVIIKSPYLMENKDSRYDKPIFVISKTTNNDGEAFFELGYKKYMTEVRVKQMYLFEQVYEKNFTIDVGQDNVVNFNLEDEENKLCFANS
jgi:hypothetical protein